MQDYQAIKDYWLDLLNKSLYAKKVWIVPKDGKTKPHWRTVRAGDGDEPAEDKPKKQDEQTNPRHAKQEEQSSNPTKQVDESKGKHHKQETQSSKSNKSDDQTSSKQKQDDSAQSQQTQTQQPQQQKHWSTMKIPQAIRDANKKYAAQFKSPDELLKDLKAKGITWNEHEHKGINVMRAKMALNAAIMNESHGFKSPFSSPVSDESQSDKADGKSTSASSDDKTTPDTQPKTPTGKASKESKTKTHEFYLSCGDRQDFYNKLKAMGVNWTENAHDGINLMRAKMALSLKIENGFDPANPPSTDDMIAQQNGIQVPAVESDGPSEEKPVEPKQEDSKQSESEDNAKSGEGESQEKKPEKTDKQNTASMSKKSPLAALRNYDSALAKGLGKESYEAMRDKLEKSENETLIKLWSKWENKMSIIVHRDDEDYEANYNPNDDSVHLSVNDTLPKDAYGRVPPYVVLFHESGHLIDWQSTLVYKGAKNPTSNLYKDGAFIYAIREDVVNFLNSYGVDGNELVNQINKEWEKEAQERYDRANTADCRWFYDNKLVPEVYQSPEELKSALNDKYKANSSNLWAYRAYKSYVANKHDYGKLRETIVQDLKKSLDGSLEDKRGAILVLDIAGGATGGLLAKKGSHSKEYWFATASAGLGGEAFAEMTEATLSSSKTSAYFKKYMPNAYKVYQDMLEDLSAEESKKGGRNK